MRIFLSYRRSDSSHIAGRLADRLRQRYGRDSVFFDVAVTPGSDWRHAIDRAVDECDVMLVVIGPGWLAADETGTRRIDDENDMVRAEVVAGLARDIRVVPVLVAGADPPRAVELPGSLAALPDRQAERLGYETFDSDVARLMATLPGRARGRRTVLGVAGVVLTAAIVAGVSFFPWPDGDPGSPATTASTVPPTSSGEPVASPSCPYEADGRAIIAPQVTLAGRASGLVFCPVRINRGKLPITGPFELAGQVIGDVEKRRSVLLWNQTADGTCDANGDSPSGGGGKFLAREADLASVDGSWSHTDQLGYAEAVTFGRQFEFVTADAANLQAILGYADEWRKRPGNNPDDYPGIVPNELPAHTVLATFDVPPGEYTGAKPCT